MPAFGIVMLITWLLLRGARESATANNVMVAVKLVVLALFIVAALTHINAANYTPFAPNGFTGIHHGAAIVFFAYIGFDAISTAAEETRNPQRNLPIGILGGLAICTVIYIVVGAVLTGHGAVHRAWQVRRSARVRAECDGPAEHRAGSSRWAPCFRWPPCCSCFSMASRASSSRWRATACSRSGPRGSMRRRAFRT